MSDDFDEPLEDLKEYKKACMQHILSELL